MNQPLATADLSRLVRRLQDTQRQSPEMAQRVLRESGIKIANLMRQKVPVDTGRLYASITSLEYKGKVVVGPVGVPYALFVEFGTYKMAAQPYILPAAREYMAQVNKLMGERAVTLIETGKPQ